MPFAQTSRAPPAVSGKAYTGIGSRGTPPQFLKCLRTVGFMLAETGWVLRSGGAGGADSACEDGCARASGMARIYLPWGSFSSQQEGAYQVPADYRVDTAKAFPEYWGRALEIAGQLHPGWHRLRRSVCTLMARNIFQVLGDDLASPSHFVVCWATGDQRDAAGHCSDVSGGTGLAVRLAYQHRIPVLNLAHPVDYQRVATKVKAWREARLATAAARPAPSP